MRILLLMLFSGSVWNWLQRLGGPGLILLGLADNSVVPLPGSMDVFVILLAARAHVWWPYYGLMGTVGAVLGGFVTYRLAEKGGEETLEKKIGKQRAQKIYKRFAKHGFATVSIGAILPPPVPIVPFLMAAGILRYPTKKFLFALTVGRGIRLFALAYLGHIYGDAIIGWLSQYYKPLLYALIGLGIAGGITAFVYFKWYRPRKQQEERERGEKVEQFPLPGHHPDKQNKTSKPA